MNKPAGVSATGTAYLGEVMDQLLDVYKKLARPLSLLLSGLLMISLYVVMLVTQLPKVSQYITELQLSFTISRALKVIAIWGSDGIDSYLSHAWLDFLFPITYGLFFTGILTALFLRRPKSMTWQQMLLLSLPILAIPFDYTENSLHMIMLSTGWIPDPKLLFLASLAASVKWACLLATAGAAVVFFFKLFTKSGMSERGKT
jgi:hypothetical protein